MPKYIVNTPLKVGKGEVAAPGETVELSAKDGDPLVLCGALAAAPAKQEPKKSADGGKDAKKNGDDKGAGKTGDDNDAKKNGDDKGAGKTGDDNDAGDASAKKDGAKAPS